MPSDGQWPHSQNTQQTAMLFLIQRCFVVEKATQLSGSEYYHKIDQYFIKNIVSIQALCRHSGIMRRYFLPDGVSLNMWKLILVDLVNCYLLPMSLLFAWDLTRHLTCTVSFKAN